MTANPFVCFRAEPEGRNGLWASIGRRQNRSNIPKATLNDVMPTLSGPRTYDLQGEP